MSAYVDRALIERLLEDESLSFREIARQAACSDWTVRSIARGLTGDERPMKREASSAADEPLGVVGWLKFAGIVAAFIGVIWLAARGVSLESGSMP